MITYNSDNSIINPTAHTLSPSRALAAPERKFSLFTNSMQTVPSCDLTLSELIDGISNGKWKSEVEDCRQALNVEGKKKYDEVRKTAVPAVSLSAKLKTRKKGTLEKKGAVHSGLLQLDFDAKDHPSLTVDLLREKVCEAPFVAACFLSLSGKGVKAIGLCPAEFDSHFGSWLAADEYFRAQGLIMDASTKDETRLSFVSYDPRAFYWDEATELTPLPVLVKTTPTESSGGAEDPEHVRRVLNTLSEKIGAYHNRETWWHILSSTVDAVGEDLAGEIVDEFFPPLEPNHESASSIKRKDRGTWLSLRKYGIDPEDKTKFMPDLRTPPSFPLHCLPPVAEKMVKEMVRVSTAQNEPLAAACILGTLSASIGAGLELPTGGGRTVRGNLFLLAIAESGTGKGENFALAAAPFFEAEGDAMKLWDALEKPNIESELAVAEKRAKRFCDIAAKVGETASEEGVALNNFKLATASIAELKSKLESSPRYHVADVTKEALAVAMQGQSGEALASMSSEARGILSIVKGRYGKEGGDEDIYCSGYSGDTITVDRIGRQRVTLRRPCLSILWMIQPDAARKALDDSSLMESGMIPRFLIFDPKAEPKERFEHPAPIAAAISTAWGKRVKDLIRVYRDKGNEPKTVSVSAEATKILDEFERETVRRRKRSGDLADVASFVARWAENASRLALVLHSAQYGKNAHSKPLAPETASNAIEILRWFADRQLEILHRGRRERHRKDLLALLALLAERDGTMTFRELKRSHSLEDEKIRELHSFFPHDFNIVRCDTGGRPSWVVTNVKTHSKINNEGGG